MQDGPVDHRLVGIARDRVNLIFRNSPSYQNRAHFLQCCFKESGKFNFAMGISLPFPSNFCFLLHGSSRSVCWSLCSYLSRRWIVPVAAKRRWKKRLWLPLGGKLSYCRLCNRVNWCRRNRLRPSLRQGLPDCWSGWRANGCRGNGLRSPLRKALSDCRLCNRVN